MCDAALKINIKQDRVDFTVPWDKNFFIEYTIQGEDVYVQSKLMNINHRFNKQLFTYFVYYVGYTICKKYDYPESWVQYFINGEVSKDLYIDGLSLRNLHNEVKYILKRGLSIEDIQQLMTFDYYEEIDRLFELMKILGGIFYE